nr:universal stress protein [uncultured Leptotrichia sp.]
MIVGLARRLRIDFNKNNKIGVIKMNKMVKIWIINKATEMVVAKIYKNEIINKTKSGAEKFDAIANGFWEKLENYILKEKEIDRKWIPNFIEEVGEDTILSCIKEMKTKLIPSEFIQQIFDFEKKNDKKNIL